MSPLLLGDLPFELLAAYLEGHAPVGFVLLDAGGRLKQWTEGFQRLLGDLPLEPDLPASSLLDSDSPVLSALRNPAAEHGEALERTVGVQWTCWKPGQNQVETRCRSLALASGVLLIVEPVYPDDAALVQETAGLREQLEEARATIEALTRTDALTGLPNRRSLEEKLHDEVARAGRHGTALSVAFVKPDGMSEICERQGRDASDEIMKALGFLLDTVLRNVDTAGRWEGEELLLLLPNTSLSNARRVLDRLRKALADEELQGIAQPITFSAGMAAFRQGDSMVSLVERAGEALAGTKAAGRDRVEVAE